MARTVAIDSDVETGFDSAARMLDPILGRTIGSGAWDPLAQIWT
jgi:hypothetical protein